MRALLAGTILILTTGLAGCAYWGNDPPSPDRAWSRTVQGFSESRRDAVWKATLQVLGDYKVKRKDFSGGVAVTDWKTAVFTRDALGPPGMYVYQPNLPDPSYRTLQTPPRWLNINFEVKKRFTVSLEEIQEGTLRVSVNRQMYVTYFDGPKNSMNPDVYEKLRWSFDTEEELKRILNNILGAVSEGN